jgi:uncharacterized membrane protein
MKSSSKILKFIDYIKSAFLNGFFTLLPLAMTIWLFRTIFRLVKGWIEPLHQFIPPKLCCVPHSEIIIVILFIILMGIILKLFFLKKIVHVIEENIVFKIPLIKQVYGGIKQLVHALTRHDQNSFHTVVIVEFPRKGSYSLGFLTNKLDIHYNNQKNLCSVFIPTTPNPTTGFLIILPEDECQIVDMTRHEAMTMIISGGIVSPKQN